MGSGGVAIAALPTVICLKVPFSDGLGGVIPHTVEVSPLVKVCNSLCLKLSYLKILLSTRQQNFPPASSFVKLL